MSELRKAYQQKTLSSQEKLVEAFANWLSKNVIIINEDIDRRTVKKLVSSIQKFDDKFGPFKSKIPTISMMIDNAEDNLQKVITGKVNNKKASDMLSRLSYLYSAFSKFFSDDLDILMMSHLFKAPKENPDVRLDILSPQDGTKYDPAAIRDAFRNALEPGKDDMKFIRKIYKSRVPLIDSLSIANEMLKLSYNELQSLKGGGKVPMVATPPSTGPEEGGELDLGLDGAPAEEAPAPVPPGQKESVARNQKKS